MQKSWFLSELRSNVTSHQAGTNCRSMKFRAKLRSVHFPCSMVPKLWSKRERHYHFRSQQTMRAALPSQNSAKTSSFLPKTTWPWAWTKKVYFSRLERRVLNCSFEYSHNFNTIPYFLASAEKKKTWNIVKRKLSFLSLENMREWEIEDVENEMDSLPKIPRFLKNSGGWIDFEIHFSEDLVHCARYR